MFILLWIHQFESLKSHVLHFLKNKKKETHTSVTQTPNFSLILLVFSGLNIQCTCAFACMKLTPTPSTVSSWIQTLYFCAWGAMCVCAGISYLFFLFSTLFLGGEHSHIKVKGQCMKSPIDTLYLLLRWGLSLNLGLTDSARLVGSVSATSTEVTTAHYHPSFLRKLRDPNSAPGDYRATTFLTEPAHLLFCLPWTLSASGRSAEIKTMAHWPSDVLQESFWEFGGNIIKVFSWKKMANILIHWLS